MKISEAQVPTEHALSYMRQLCRHWAHKFPVEFNDEQGLVELPTAKCQLRVAPAMLSVRLEIADGADEAHIERVVAEHLQRFGFREQLVFHWQHPAGVDA